MLESDDVLQFCELNNKSDKNEKKKPTATEITYYFTNKRSLSFVSSHYTTILLSILLNC